MRTWWSWWVLARMRPVGVESEGVEGEGVEVDSTAVVVAVE